MKKSLKRAALLAVTGAMLAGTAVSSYADSLYNGQWCVEDNGYWFKLSEDGSVFLANTWYWIKDSDGVIRCYYFDQNGWLATNQTIGDYILNDQGQWVVDGVVQTRGDADGDFATHTDLSAAAAAAAVTEQASAADTGAVVGDSGAAPAATGSTGNATAKSKKYYKSSGAGDNPANASFTQAYENSGISGTTATNSWANFRVNFPGVTLVTDDSGSGTDFYASSDDKGNITVTYFPLDKYSAGNTSLASFISLYIADRRGFNGVQDADIALGAYTFKQLTKAETTPEGTEYDHAYIRQIDGTNYAMVILVEDNGSNNDYLDALRGMSTAH